jgi:hypothetical protein
MKTSELSSGESSRTANCHSNVIVLPPFWAEPGSPQASIAEVGPCGGFSGGVDA